MQNTARPGTKLHARIVAGGYIPLPPTHAQYDAIDAATVEME
jgi:hypothetical protein